MAKTKKTTAAPETAQKAQEQQDMSQDTQGQKTASETAQEGAVTAQGTSFGSAERPSRQPLASQELIGPDDPADLLGCQDEDTDEAELTEGLYVEYAVTAGGGLRLRESPSTDAPIIAVLPRGAGVLACEEPENGWLHVRTGRLEGWMMAQHLEALLMPKWPSLGGGKLPYAVE